MVARSSGEVEFRVVVQGICDFMWIRFLKSLKMIGSAHIKSYRGNKATI